MPVHKEALAAQLYAVPEPEQVSQLPVHKEALAAQLYGPNPVPEHTSQLPVQVELLPPQLKEVPEPVHCSQLPVVLQRATEAVQLPEVQTSQLPVQSASTFVHVPIEPATLQRSQLPAQAVLQQ